MTTLLSFDGVALLTAHLDMRSNHDLTLAQNQSWPWRHAGVPMKRPIAGVAMGLILQPDGRFCVLTDILGSEDALGDMDFKVAGDADGVTAFQMDIKVSKTSTEGPSVV